MQQFEIELSKNQILQNTIQCPNCKQNIFNGKLKTNRVVCPRCKYGDFCSLCLRKWNSQNHNICGNKECKVKDQILQKSPWKKIFRLKDSNNNTLDVKAPIHRACPKCFSLIQHNGGCKHMRCPCCKQSFCWICLQLSQNGVLKCGRFNGYCKKIAPVQKINN